MPEVKSRHVSADVTASPPGMLGRSTPSFDSNNDNNSHTKTGGKHHPGKNALVRFFFFFSVCICCKECVCACVMHTAWMLPTQSIWWSFSLYGQILSICCVKKKCCISLLFQDFAKHTTVQPLRCDEGQDSCQWAKKKKNPELEYERMFSQLQSFLLLVTSL